MISLESSRIIQRTECDQPERVCIYMFVFEFIYACIIWHRIYQIDGFAILYLYKQFFFKMLYSIVENWLEFSVNLDFISILFKSFQCYLYY